MTLRLNTFLAALFVSSLLMSSCQEEDSPSVNTDGTTNAPVFTLESVDGGSKSLSDYSGGPLIIFFFGDKCPLCKAAAPDIEAELAQKYKDTSVNIIGIDVWDGTQSSVNDFRTGTKVTFDLLLKGSATAKAFGTTYDRLVVVSADGKLVHVGTSSADNDINNVIKTVDALL